MFAFKAIAENFSILHVITLYITFTIFFSHCLYLASLHSRIPGAFFDWFEVVIVTMPTIGYGDRPVPSFIQRIIVYSIVITGAAMNSFITITMLKNFEMCQESKIVIFCYIRLR